MKQCRKRRCSVVSAVYIGASEANRKWNIQRKNELLPSEASLQAEFNVSRITIRRSLQDLELAGFIKVQKGKGAMVLANRKYTDLVGVSSFSQDAVKSGERPSSIILEFEK